MEALSIKSRISGNPYVGRGIIIGMTGDADTAAVAYFIMGRSAGSRNREFIEDGDNLTIRPFDAGALKHPELVVYSPIRAMENRLIVTNGDQTDTICTHILNGGTFEGALETREFEPDPPLFTPRVSGMLEFSDGSFSYKLNILKSADELGSGCLRQTFSYPALPGIGHFLHTYMTDGNPVPSFEGEPEKVVIPGDIDAFTREIWDNLDANNRVSLYTRYVDLSTGKYEKRLINRYPEA